MLKAPNDDIDCSISSCENACFTLFEKNNTDFKVYPVTKNCWYGETPSCGNKWVF